MKATIFSLINGFVRLLIYVTQSILGALVQLLSIFSLLVVIFGIPLIIHFGFSPTVEFVREWLQYEANEVLRGTLSSVADGATFLGIVAALGLAPYLFSKATESIPKSLSSILREFLNILRDDWLPKIHNLGQSSHLRILVTKRLKGLGSTLLASISVLVSIAVVAIAVAWATMEEGERVVEAVVRVNGQTVTNVISEGTEIDIRCENDSGTTTPPAEQVVVTGASASIFLRCQPGGQGGETIDPVAVTLVLLATTLEGLAANIETLPTATALREQLLVIQNDMDVHLNRHLELMTARIDQLDEDLRGQVEGASP